MKPVLFLAAALALAATPALSQDAPAPAPPPPGPPPPSNYMSTPFDAGARFRVDSAQDLRRQCFNGRFIAGSNRAGDRTVYVQTKSGGIFRLELAGDCAALSGAKRLTVRANGNDVICPGQAATLVLNTDAGLKRCRIDEVRHLSPTEVAELAPKDRR